MVRGQIDIATEEVLARARMENLKAGIKLPDFEARAKEEYIGHKDTYVIPGDITVQHVLIGNKTRDEKDARALADTVEKEAKAHPDQFDALVEKYSDDESKTTNKGVMKDVGKGAYVAAFVEGSKALKKAGDISPPVKTKFGYHVIKLVSRTPDKQQTFDEVHDRIVARLKSDFISKTVQQHVDEVRNQHIDANQQMVESLRTRYGAVTSADPATAIDTSGILSTQP